MVLLLDLQLKAWDEPSEPFLHRENDEKKVSQDANGICQQQFWVRRALLF